MSSSDFDAWYSKQNHAGKSDYQRAKEAYEAGKESMRTANNQDQLTERVLLEDGF